MTVARVLIAASIAASGLASADEFRFETFRYGRRALGMGGAVTAYADEPEALLYNPAGLAMVSGLRFSGSLHFLGFDRHRVEDGLYNDRGGPHEDLRSGDLLPVPSSSVLSKGFGGGDRHVLAIATFLASERDEAFAESRGEPANVAGFDHHEESVELDRFDSLVLRGLSYAHRVRDDLAVGVSLYWAEHTRSFSARRVTLLTSDDMMRQRAGFADATTREETEADSFLVHAGVLWTVTPAWRLGLACATRSFGFYGEGEVRSILVSSGDPARAEAVPLYEVHRYDVDVDSALPWSCRAGVAYTGERWVLTADVSGHLPVDYTRFELPDTPRDFTSGIRERVEGQAVLNGAIGVEYRPSPAWPLRAGLFTNRSAAPDVPAEPTWLAPAHIDSYGATLSGGHLGRNTSVAIGAEYQIGRGHDVVPRDFMSLVGDPSFARVERDDWRVVVFISGAVGFADKSADKLLEGR